MRVMGPRSTHLTTALAVALLALHAPALAKSARTARSAPKHLAEPSASDFLPGIDDQLLGEAALRGLSEQLAGAKPGSLRWADRAHQLVRQSLARAFHARATARQKTGKGPVPRLQRHHYATLAAKAQKRARQLCQQLLTIKRDPRADETLISVAATLIAAGKAATARTYMTNLIRHYPKSRHIALVYTLFGDLYARRGGLKQAIALYQRALRFRQAAVYPYVLYALGTVHAAKGTHRKALQRFVVLLRSGLKGATRRVQLLLTAPSRRGLVRSYSSVGQPARARAFFRRVLPKAHLGVALRELAAIYRAAKNNSAADLLRAP
jgi:tetratricopeptide (TPR) repeat protein